MTDFYTLLIQFMLFVVAIFFLAIIVLAIFNLSSSVISFRKRTILKDTRYLEEKF